MVRMKGVFNLDVLLCFLSSLFILYVLCLGLSRIDTGTFPSPLHFATQTNLPGIGYDWYYRESTESKETEKCQK